MIRINLALRKQLSISAEGKRSVGTAFSQIRSLKAFRDLRPGDLSLDKLRMLPLRQIFISVGVTAVALHFFGTMKAEKLSVVQTELAREEAAFKKLNAEYALAKKYEPQKKQLDADEAILRNKIETSKALIAGREVPPKLLIALATGTPPNVWVSEFALDKDGLKLKGFSLGYEQISDFVKALGESIYLKDIKLVATSRVKDDSGIDVESFELTGAQR